MSLLREPFADFIFHEDLEKQLSFFVENPEHLPNAVVFWGEPGTGKTSFAKLFAETFAANTGYYPMCETKIDKDFRKTASLERTSVSLDFSGGGYVFDTIHILDEFHNLAPKDQDYFKTKIDALRPDDRLIVILNTLPNKPNIEQMLSPAMVSRLWSFNFNLPLSKATQHCSRIREKFPLLSEQKIYSLLPDMRQIVKAQQMEELTRRFGSQ
jgi:replication-associated recombination protein RarA